MLRDAVAVLAQLCRVTILLAVVLAGVFLLEERFAAGVPAEPADPTSATLLAFGALNGQRVLAAGEWYRIGSMALLHASPEHLLLNEAALLAIGLLFEAMFGWAWLVLAFCVGALGASLMSLATDPAELTVVGASGAIMGVCAAGFLASFRMPFGTGGTIRFRSIVMLLLTLLPWLSGVSVANVDDAGHVGGMMGGALVGLVLWRYWPAPGASAPRRSVAAMLALPVGVLFLAAAGTAALASRHSPFGHLLPDDPAPETPADAERLVLTYPGDPRSWEERGRAAYGEARYEAAEADFRTALRLAGQLRPVFPPDDDMIFQGFIALSLSAEGRQDAAAVMAQEPCRGGAKVLGDELDADMRERHLCRP